MQEYKEKCHECDTALRDNKFCDSCQMLRKPQESHILKRHVWFLSYNGYMNYGNIFSSEESARATFKDEVDWRRNLPEFQNIVVNDRLDSATYTMYGEKWTLSLEKAVLND